MTDELETRTSLEKTDDGTAAPLGQIGAYTLIRALGEGGMGTVYLAEQTTPVERRVALKVIKLGMDTREVVARFEAERQALAVMDHPGIARVFDGGATDNGRPFFAMEFVQGEPITQFADRAGLGIRERVTLLIDVCRAVQHAHQKGIIHRDLKPSNVLVTLQDGRPAAKIIDFGIAKAIERPLTDQTFATGIGQFVGTPAYMSPEQLGLTNQDVDTRADIYSLGVLLYELLAGVRPFEPRELETGHNLVAAVRDDEARRPSARLTEAGDDVQRKIATARRTDTVTLRRALERELDWIALKAIEKDRTRRYDTANTLAGDLQRYLNDEPVTARPPSRGYRARKFIARHRMGVGAAAAILVLIAGAAIVILFQSARVARERDRATLEAAKSQTVSDFLQEMLSSANPFGTGNRTVTVVEALAAAERRLDSTLASQPEVAGAVRRTLGQTYEGLGEYERAEKILREAVSRSRTSGRQVDLAADLNELADVVRSSGKPADALPIAREAVAVGRAAGVAPRDLAAMQFTLAECIRQNGDADAALAMANEVLDTRTRLAPESTMVATSLRQLGVIASDKGDLATAERHFLRAVEIQRRHLGPDHYAVAGTLNDLATNYIAGTQFDKALETLQEVERIYRIVLGDVHPELATTLENLANVLFRQKRLPEATARLEEVLAIRKKALGDDSMPVARTTFNLGMVYSDAGDLAKSEANLVEGVARLRRALGETHPDLVSALRGLALLRERQGRLPDAERISRESLALAENVLGADHAGTATSHQRLAMTLIKQKRYAEAETHLLRSRAIREQRFGPTAGPTQQIVGNLITLYTAWGKPDKANALKK